jgi:hypothetical protein
VLLTHVGIFFLNKISAIKYISETLGQMINLFLAGLVRASGLQTWACIVGFRWGR